MALYKLAEAAKARSEYRDRGCTWAVAPVVGLRPFFSRLFAVPRRIIEKGIPQDLAWDIGSFPFVAGPRPSGLD